MSSSEVLGYWGPVTSTVDWCEVNYSWSFYVAEWFNTFSSFAMVFVGLLGVMLHNTNHRKSILERRFTLGFLAVSLVGLGSAAFHSTLQFNLQMLDEVPMLWSVLIMFYSLIEHNSVKPQYGIIFPITLFVYGCIVTFLVCFTKGLMQQITFHLSFSILELYSLYRVWILYTSKKQADPNIRKLFTTGFISYVIAIFCWIFDYSLCFFISKLPNYGIPNPELHAWWHVMVSIGLYLLVVFLLYSRQINLGKTPTLKYFFGIIPYIEISTHLKEL